MQRLERLQEELGAEIDVLTARFLGRWIPAAPEHVPDEFQHDVKAYCVLAHAAFEEFVEEISLVAMKSAEDAWLAKKHSQATMALLLFYNASIGAVDEEEKPQERVFDQIRQCMDDCIRKHSTALSKNHGFSLKYLRTILTPIGIDVPDSVKHLESLRELADARGSYAHSLAKRAMYGQWKRADRPMTPEQARASVTDCLELCRTLAQRALRLIA